ncbi:hypothetical protein ALC62_00341 [Cyphomyrmex costatus]|uniref:Uncharacterized protein n=1 Tax=Cyphomyrmex costatus TaxID=456900 RepID=A0A195D703_9HYME|nr:hypothetical protein ALC62_00341 [Cyphomyrmex costatus]
MIDDRQLSPERSREEVHLPNRGHGRHGVRENRIPPLSLLKRKRCRAEPVRPPFAAVSFRPRATSKKQKEYKDDNLRLSPFAQRIDFTGFHERTQRNVPRAALRVYRKKGRNRADRRCSGLCLKTNEHRTARSRALVISRDKKAEVDLGPNGSFSATEYANIRDEEKTREPKNEPAHARIISAGQGIFITWGPSRLKQMLDEAAV